MEIRVLRYFLKAVQEENITRAAEAAGRGDLRTGG